jgi:hypothetical protein
MEGSDYDTEAEWKPRVPKISTTCWGPELPEFSGVKAKARGKSTSSTNIDIGKLKAEQQIKSFFWWWCWGGGA